MIGETITGYESTDGKEITGVIRDKVRICQAIEMGMPMPGQIGGSMRKQTMPMPLDAYLVETSTGKLHLVNPGSVKSINVVSTVNGIPKIIS